MKIKSLLLLGLSIALAMPLSANAQRKMEKLDRGVVAVRTSSTATFISWRVLGLDAASTTFNLYRSTNSGAATKLNASPLTVSNYADTSASSANSYSYYVKPVIGGVEQAASIPFSIASGGPVQYAYRIPLQTWTDYTSRYVWVGDLDGDGEYDYVIDRHPTTAGISQKVEAYTSAGVRLWVIDLGPNSTNTYNIEPGPATIDVGHWDGLTVYDFDGDGRAEIALRSADGVVFGDGTTLSGLGTNIQAISFISGMTGKERARINVPTDYLTDGPVAAHLGVAYLNGTTPSLIAQVKNRIGSGSFNHMAIAYDFAANNTITQKWKYNRSSEAAAPDNHQIRTFDVDQNGTDEFCDGGYCLNPNGTFRYKVGNDNPNVVHGDRWDIGNFDPNRAGLEGFDIQQNNPNLLLYLTYDASTGATINAHYGSVVEDTARGVVADIDSNYSGYEYWSFHGYHRIDTGATVNASTPYPNFRIWWDGDVGSETLDEGKVEKWNPATSSNSRLFTVSSSTTGNPTGINLSGGRPFLYGDIRGDWREEIVSMNAAFNELIICTTPTPTTTRLYTLAQNPAYRNALTVKGYLQSPQLDYYLGNGMTTPANPNISYVPVVLQSELDTTSGGGTNLLNNRSGYTGTGFADFPGTGGYVEWTRVSGAGGGSRTLTFRYANGSGASRTGQLLVNGVAQAITFPATSGWTNWATLSVTVTLNAAATNTIRLESNGADLANIDYLTIP